MGDCSDSTVVRLLPVKLLSTAADSFERKKNKTKNRLDFKLLIVSFTKLHFTDTRVKSDQKQFRIIIVTNYFQRPHPDHTPTPVTRSYRCADMIDDRRRVRSHYRDALLS